MSWFKCKIRLGKTNCIEYIQAVSRGHVTTILCIKYGESISNTAQIIELGLPSFKGFKVEIHFKQSIEKRNVLAIEKEHVQSDIYKEFRKKEIIKLIIHGEDEYGGP